MAMEIQAWLVSYLAEVLEIEPDNVGVDSPFDRFGLDSARVVVMTGDMQDWLGCELRPTLAYDYPTIDALARHLAEECKAKSIRCYCDTGMHFGVGKQTRSSPGE